ncbi:hypothetical protein LXL04_000294 [Taraxacum kok-saghyz]
MRHVPVTVRQTNETHSFSHHDVCLDETLRNSPQPQNRSLTATPKAPRALHRTYPPIIPYNRVIGGGGGRSKVVVGRRWQPPWLLNLRLLQSDYMSEIQTHKSWNVGIGVVPAGKMQHPLSEVTELAGKHTNSSLESFCSRRLRFLYTRAQHRPHEGLCSSHLRFQGQLQQEQLSRRSLLPASSSLGNEHKQMNGKMACVLLEFVAWESKEVYLSGGDVKDGNHRCSRCQLVSYVQDALQFTCMITNNREQMKSGDVKKTNSLFAADCRRLDHLFFCRALQMWSADCRCFGSEKTNRTLVILGGRTIFAPSQEWILNQITGENFWLGECHQVSDGAHMHTRLH